MAELFKKINPRVHFIGIGGIGMSGIALIMLRKGIKVSGSDLKESRITDELKNNGAVIFRGHNPENVHGADIVVYSSAIKEDNPEFCESNKLKISLFKRAQALAWLMEDKEVITVTGSHGKTTTSSLVSCLLHNAGLSPTAAIGGIVKNLDTNACSGEGKYFVAEADESDGSFLYYAPKFSIITNIDREHLDYYRNFDNEVNAFKEFINKTKAGGCVYACGDDPSLRMILKRYPHRHMLFGMDASWHIYPKNIKINGLSSEFDCILEGKFAGRFGLSLGGLHNISNALSVIALGLELAIDQKIIKETLLKFKGAGRRMEIKFENEELMIIDDYAHHPTEIKATLKAIKNIKRNRIVVVFQPHRFSRTFLLMDEFARSFDLADKVIITDIYAANEKPLKGVSAQNICEKIKEYSPGKEVEYLAKEKIISRVLEIIRPNDLVITLGAGDIIKTCDELVQNLQK